MWIKIRRFALGAGATLGPQPGAKIAPPAPAWLLRRPPPVQAGAAPNQSSVLSGAPDTNSSKTRPGAPGSGGRLISRAPLHEWRGRMAHRQMRPTVASDTNTRTRPSHPRPPST